jgi:hypothetical protein
MKIRWTPDSVRFRITPEELQTLENAQPISAALSLGETVAWSALIHVVPAETGSTLRFEAGVLLLRLAHADLQTLASSANEGVYLREGELRFMIEKDFPCAHPRAAEAAETPTETFAPPEGFEERKNAPESEERMACALLLPVSLIFSIFSIFRSRFALGTLGACHAPLRVTLDKNKYVRIPQRSGY